MIECNDDKHAGKILENAVDVKIHIAEEIIKSIPNAIPEDRTSCDYLKLEAKSEAFLFFLCSAHDCTLRIISEKILDKWLRTDSLNKMLEEIKKIPKENEKYKIAQSLLKIIKLYFPNPQHYAKRIDKKTRLQALINTLELGHGVIAESESLFTVTNGNRVKNSKMDDYPEPVYENKKQDGFYVRYWDLEKSILSVIRGIRNEVSHKRIIMSMGKAQNRSKGFNKNNSYVFWVKNPDFFTSDEIKNQEYLPHAYKEFEVDNPKEFFLLSLEKTKEFLKDVNSVCKLRENP